MLKKNLLGYAAACVASCGLLISPPVINAAERPAPQHAQVRSLDVTLSNSSLGGQYLTSAGNAIDGATVVLRKAGRPIAETQTDSRGVFTFQNLRSGAYEVVTASGVQPVRAWDATIAPPAASEYATIIADGAVRGQMGGGGFLTAVGLGVGIAGLAVGVVGLSKANDNEDKIDELQDQIDEIWDIVSP